MRFCTYTQLKIRKGKIFTYKVAWKEIEHLRMQRVHIQKYIDSIGNNKIIINLTNPDSFDTDMQ